jgi:hypothetical protein
MNLKSGSRRVWPVSRGCSLLRGTWSYLRICRRSVLPYTRFCNCLLITITFYTLLTSLFCISQLFQYCSPQILNYCIYPACIVPCRGAFVLLGQLMSFIVSYSAKGIGHRQTNNIRLSILHEYKNISILPQHVLILERLIKCETFFSGWHVIFIKPQHQTWGLGVYLGISVSICLSICPSIRDLFSGHFFKI